MGTRTETYIGTLHVLNCGVCGVPHGIPVEIFNRCDRDHSENWYCPNGHYLHFLGKTEASKLRAQVAALEGAVVEERQRTERAREEAEHRKRQLAAAKGRITKMRRRAAAGVCPCCNRQFVQVVRHMAAKHPDELAEMTATV